MSAHEELHRLAGDFERRARELRALADTLPANFSYANAEAERALVQLVHGTIVLR